MSSLSAQTPLPQSADPQPAPESKAQRDRDYTVFCGVIGAIFGALIVYSQTRAFCWDEGFHLLAATMIRQGKRPYIDFTFPQTPLNAYLNAAAMAIFGESWRPTHVIASLLLGAGIFLAADFVFRRFPVREWRLAASIFCAVLIASVYNVVAFATVAQAYAICLFLTVASFRLACAAIRRDARRGNLALIFAAGLCASASAACSMLTAAAVPVILAWCVIGNKSAPRWKTAAVFLGAAVIPFIPVIWLFCESPRLVWFNVIQYQAMYRRMNWGEATPHDVEVFFDVTGSPPALMLILLGTAGLAFVSRLGEKLLRREFYFSTAIAVAIGAELWTAHPTFERYFLLTVPFLAIPATVGLYLVGSRLYRPDRPWAAVGAAGALALMTLAGQFFEDRDSLKWAGMQRVAQKVMEVTPPGATLYADELIYFLTRRPAPPGMEFAYGHKLELPPERAKSLHILPESQLDQMMAGKAFATAESCDDDEIDHLKLKSLYAEHEELDDCHVFWHPK